MPLPLPLPHTTDLAVKSYSFVTRTADRSRLVQSGAGDAVYGVVGQFRDQLAVDGDRTTLILSPTASRAVRRGEYLKAAADGYAVPATYPTPDNAGTDKIGARVETGGNPGESLSVTVTTILPPS